MTDDRTDEHERPPDDPSRTSPQRTAPLPADKPRPTTFDNEWDEAPTTNTFRIPRS